MHAFNVGFENLVSSNGLFDGSKTNIDFGYLPIVMKLPFIGGGITVGADVFSDRASTTPLDWDAMHIESKHGNGSWDLPTSRPAH